MAPEREAAPRPPFPTRQVVPVRRPLPEQVPDSVTPHRYARMLDVLDRRQPDLTVVLENVHDAHNAGAVARSCEAVGVGVLHLVEGVERAPEPSSGTTSSAHLWMEVRRHRSVRAAYAALRAEGFAIVATAIGADAREPWSVDFTRPTALVLGNEQRGVSSEAAAAADLRVFIPMHGMVQSLNLSVAAGALLFEVMRQRQAAALYERPRLADSDRRRLLETWLDRERGNAAR